MSERYEYISRVHFGISNSSFVGLLGANGTQSSSGDVPFNKHIVTTDNLGYYNYYVSEVLNVYNVNWNKLNSWNLIDGSKVVEIKGVNYNVRGLKGSPTGNCEYDLMIGHDKLNTVICVDEDPANNLNSIARKGDASSSFAKDISSSSLYCTFMLIEFLGNSPIIQTETSDLGELLSFTDVSYSINDYMHSNYIIKITLDGNIVEEMTSNSNTYNGTIRLNNFNSISYGKHTINIEVDNGGYKGKSLMVITFNKIKEPIPTIPTNSSLKVAVAHNKEIKNDISYQCYKLKNKLVDKGVKVISDKLSSLIDNVETINKSIFPSWANNKLQSVCCSDFVSVQQQSGVASVVDDFLYAWFVETAKFNINTNTWTSLIKSPVRCAGISFEYNGLIYIINQSAVSQLYNPLTDTYTSLSQMPNVGYPIRGDIDPTTGIVYYKGANMNFTSYDVTTNTFTTLANTTHNFSECGVIYINGKVYMCGGNDNGTVREYVYTYDIMTNIHSYVAKLSGVFGCQIIALDEDNIIIYGGKATTSAYGRYTQVYNIPSQSRTGLLDLLLPSSYNAAFCKNSKYIFHVGGVLGNSLYGGVHLINNPWVDIK